MEGMIRIKLVRSPICTPEKHKRVVKGLGLRKLNQIVVRPDSPVFRGMVKKVPHLNNVEALPLDRQRWLSDHSLQAADATLVAAPIRLIRNEQNATLQVAIKFAYHLLPARHLKCVSPKDQLQASTQRPLPRALQPNQHQRDLSLPIRMLSRGT